MSFRVLRWTAWRVGLSIFNQDHDKMLGEHLFLQAEMRGEVLQLESISSNKAQKPLTPLQIELRCYILRELMGKLSSVKSSLVILVQGGNGMKQAKTHSMERTQDTKVKQSFSSPTTCFLWLPAHMKTSSNSRVRIRPSFDRQMYLLFWQAMAVDMCHFALP